MPLCPEIGGYFELERGRGTLLHDNAIALNCGRGCLRYLIRVHGIREIWLPDYMCGVVRSTCESMGVRVFTYTIGKDFEPIWSFEVSRGQWLYLADFFGQLTDECVARAYEVSAGRVVIDEAQGYFMMPRGSVDTLYTCRKYFGVPDGAFLYTNEKTDYELKRDVSFQRMEQVLGRVELGSATFLHAAQVNNDEVDPGEPRMMSALTERLLKSIDYELTRRQREENYAVLEKNLSSINQLDPRMPPGPFAYPLLVENGPQIRSKLATKGVFVPTLWPEVVERVPVGSVANIYAQNILPLPIDQRYGPSEMKYIVECLVEEGVA